MSDTLVVYYSRKGENYMPGGIQVLEKGHTESAAEYIRDALDADLFEIDTATPYAETYKECCAQAAAEMKAGARPELRRYLDDISGYHTIFVCFPCWCGTAPMCVFTFLEHYDLTGKKIVPLCTNEGSGMGKSERDIQKLASGAEVKKGLPITGSSAADSENTVKRWLTANGLL